MMGDAFQARAGRALHGANLRCLRHTATIAIAALALASCEPPKDAFQECIFTLAGITHAATPEIIQECDKRTSHLGNDEALTIARILKAQNDRIAVLEAKKAKK